MAETTGPEPADATAAEPADVAAAEPADATAPLPPKRTTRIWKATTGLAAAGLLAVLALTGPGSLDVLSRRSPAAEPVWAAPCRTVTDAPTERAPLAYCARVSGRVLDIERSDTGEVHLLVAGRFHLTIVEVPRGGRAPSRGAWVSAVGPLQRASDGQRELEAVELKS